MLHSELLIPSLTSKLIRKIFGNLLTCTNKSSNCTSEKQTEFDEMRLVCNNEDAGDFLALAFIIKSFEISTKSVYKS